MENQITIGQKLEEFRKVRKDLVLYLDSQNLSKREIARLLGGSSIRIVSEILGEEINVNDKQAA